MSRDSEKRPWESVEEDEETGARETRKGRSSVPGESSSSNPREIQVVLIDESLEVERQGRQVDMEIEPEADVSSVDSIGVEAFGEAGVEASRLDQSVDRVFAPQEREQPSSGQFAVWVAEGLRVESGSHPDVEPVSPDQEVEKQDEFQQVTLQDLVSEKVVHSVNQQMAPTRRRSQGRPRVELDDEDPVFSWTGGSLYSSGRPTLVIHRSSEDLDTRSFLQVLLRDTYKEIEGGEPGAETVEFVAKEPRIPQVQRNIVTLDLTDGGWQSDMRGGSPVIERNNVDIVPTLRDVASTLYTGELGYLVVDVPDRWEGDLLQGNFFDRLVERVAEAGLPDDGENQGFFEVLRSSPVVVANPKIEAEETLFERVCRYFSVGDNGGQVSSVDQVERVREQVLRRNDWKRIALTERQSADDESDEHYFWKAAIAEGLAWEMQHSFETQRRPDQDNRPFAEFLKTQILGEGIIQTESTPSEDEQIEPDILIESYPQEWVTDGIKEFLDLEADPSQDIVFEFETGRSEGAFNFRKIRETLEKYPEADVKGKHIYVVLPTRLFFRGEKRARMILDLVESWDKVPRNRDLSASVSVPVLGAGYCRGLIPATALVDGLYEGD